MTTAQGVQAHTPQDVLSAAGLAKGVVRQASERLQGCLTYAQAMNLAAFYQRLVGGGIPPAAASDIVLARPLNSASRPCDQADEIISFVARATEQGMEPATAVTAAVERWTRDPKGVPGTEPAPRGSGAVPELPARHTPESTSSCETERGRRSMTDQEKRNGLEHERGKLEKERERLEREREKLERLQEEMEARIERQQERLEELEDELEAREEELDEREEEIEELEVEGVEGVREVLDVVSERIPNLMRGIRDTVYSPENLKVTSEALVAFYKSLVNAGMDEDQAAELMKIQMMNMQLPGFLTTEPRRRSSRVRHGRPARPARPARPVASAEPAEPTESCEEEED